MSQQQQQQQQRWLAVLRRHPALQRCLLCGEAAVGVGTFEAPELPLLVYALCETHRPTPAVVEQIEAVLSAQVEAALQINVQDTDTSVH